MIALIDIDGTIADISHRLHFIKSDGTKYIPDDAPVDWDGFFNAMVDDKPIEPVIDLVLALEKSYHIVYVTGRPHNYGDQTIKWLKFNGLYDHEFGNCIYMRTPGDHRPDYIVKRELYENMIVKDIGKADLAIEDRKQVVDMWRSLGILTLQPKDGDY